MISKSRNILKLFVSAIIFTFLIIVILNLKTTPTNSSEYRDKFIVVKPLNILDEIESGRLVNLTGFQYILPNNICQKVGKKLLGIILVTSYAGHDQLRSAHRQSISQIKLKSMGFLRVFILANLPEHEKFIKQKQLNHEQNLFGDLVQGNFMEAYRNLTYKHIMGLKWAVKQCQNAKYIVKIDDDTVFDIFHLKTYLQNLNFHTTEQFMSGYILENKRPIRVSANKWFVSIEEYPNSFYPEYLSGWLYVTNLETASHLVYESQTAKFFWIDDAFVTGILREKLEIPLERLNNWFSANSEFLDCCIRDIKEHHYKCDYFVGPNGGDSKLIIKFTEEMEKCSITECVERSPEKSLMLTCVAEIKNLLEDHGSPVVEMFSLK